MEEQVELARAISHSLSADTNSTSRGQSMYVKRRNRSSKWIHQGAVYIIQSGASSAAGRPAAFILETPGTYAVACRAINSHPGLELAQSESAQSAILHCPFPAQNFPFYFFQIACGSF